MEGWEEITKQIGINLREVGMRSDGLFLTYMYKNIFICRIRYDGIIEWVFKEHWKEGWEFKVTYTKAADFIQFWKKKIH